MSKAKNRKMIMYWVCCDCRVCREEFGLPFICLSSGFKTEQEACNEVENYSATHTSCFVAKEILEAVNEKPKQRKAA